MRRKKLNAERIAATILEILISICLFSFHADAQTRGGVLKGYKIIEGDILVREDFSLAAATWAVQFWPNGTVPFQFDANVTAANQTAILAAMAEWERVADINFIPRTNEADFVHIQDATVNNSFVGRQGGSQDINIASWGNRWIMCHELAHCLGYWHEQSRPDRDNFVQINVANIDPPQLNNFDRHDDAGQYGPYDFESVMHYGQFDFCINPCPGPTITVLPPNQTFQNTIGQRTHLSHFDTLTMSFIYAQDNWSFVDQAYTGILKIGTFLFPETIFDHGVDDVPVGGKLIVQPGNYPAVGVYSKAMTVRAPLGNVILGK